MNHLPRVPLQPEAQMLYRRAAVQFQPVLGPDREILRSLDAKDIGFP